MFHCSIETLTKIVSKEKKNPQSQIVEKEKIIQFKHSTHLAIFAHYELSGFYLTLAVLTSLEQYVLLGPHPMLSVNTESEA